MLLLSYAVLLLVVLAHIACCVRFLVKLRTQPTSWNYNANGVLSVVMLLLIALVNALYAANPHLAPEAIAFLKVALGAGRIGGPLQLGLGGIYWATIALISAVVMFKSPVLKNATDHQTRKLPPGGLWTVGVCMLLLVVLLGIMVWGLRS